ncbi:hypothetical protein QN277_008897 [Acacia crassicarpa]|uniref:Uncharacterized protein n=1 Tax=Acacia crassicarpa TaxID=499986 RepID=A0AAE1IU74_9FABA|nr:hypothetical protein QN277_008897 [Acacia crassicarpa]
MFCFLRKTIPNFGHIIDSTCPALVQLLSVQNHRLLVRYCNSIASGRHSFTVSYLIDKCGFSPQEAASASKFVSFESLEKPDSVINFLKNHGFLQSQIFRFIKEVPQFLRYDPEKNFLPKIEFFISRGVSSSDIPKIICSCPTIMKRSLSKQLIPSFDFFRGLFQSDDRFIKALRCCSAILLDINTHAVPNMKLLREIGVPESNVIRMLQMFPRALVKNPSGFKMNVEESKEMGFDPSRFHFILALWALSSLSKSTWEKKVNVYKKWGWSDEDILVAFRRYPIFMKASEDKIDAIMEFLINKLGCDASTVTRYPHIFSLSLKRRLIPRGAVIEVLLSKGLVKKKTLPVVFIYTDSTFLKRFIMNNKKEASELLNLYKGKLELAT